MTSRPAGWLVWLGVVVGVAATARLGVWQLDRAAQKTALHASWSARAQLPTLPATELARDPAAVEPQLHRRIVLQGRWAGEHTLFLDNRTRDGVAGLVVVTPLLIGPGGDAVLVQRGWLPSDPADRTRVPAVASPGGTVTIDARIAPWPLARLALSSVEEGPIRQNLDPAQLARDTKLALRPLSLLQLSDGNAMRRDWPEPPTDVAKHQGYALQWFAMSALIAGLALWHGFIRPRRGQRD